jgi:hypothetical protein
MFPDVTLLPGSPARSFGKRSTARAEAVARMTDDIERSVTAAVTGCPEAAHAVASLRLCTGVTARESKPHGVTHAHTPPLTAGRSNLALLSPQTTRTTQTVSCARSAPNSNLKPPRPPRPWRACPAYVLRGWWLILFARSARVCVVRVVCGLKSCGRPEQTAEHPPRPYAITLPLRRACVTPGVRHEPQTGNGKTRALPLMDRT